MYRASVLSKMEEEDWKVSDEQVKVGYHLAVDVTAGPATLATAEAELTADAAFRSNAATAIALVIATLQSFTNVSCVAVRHKSNARSKSQHSTERRQRAACTALTVHFERLDIVIIAFAVVRGAKLEYRFVTKLADPHNHNVNSAVPKARKL